MQNINVVLTAVMASLLAMASMACLNDTDNMGGGGTASMVSTDSMANMSLLSAFTGPNSVTISGTWTNLTFSSTGDMTVEISFDAATNVATITLDIDGNVYGGADPGPEVFMIDMTDFINNGTDTLMFTSATYGDVEIDFTFFTDNTGTFIGTAENEPSNNVENAEFSGSFEINGSTVTFEITSASFVFLGTSVTMSHNLTATIN